MDAENERTDSNKVSHSGVKTQTAHSLSTANGKFAALQILHLALASSPVRLDGKISHFELLSLFTVPFLVFLFLFFLFSDLSPSLLLLLLSLVCFRLFWCEAGRHDEA